MWLMRPQAEFTCDIGFDVFSFMRDNDMAYGFNKAVLDDAPTFRPLWEKTQHFIETHKDLLDSDADYTWLLDTLARWMKVPGSESINPSEFEDLDEDISTVDTDDSNIIIFDGEAAHIGSVSASCDPYAVPGAFTTRLGGVCDKCSIYPNFEIGSLSFFRSPEHLAYFDHLESTGGLYSYNFGEVPMHSLSASMFLPKRRMWLFRDEKICCEDYSMTCPHTPRQTVDPESTAGPWFLADSIGSAWFGAGGGHGGLRVGDPADGMVALHAL